MLCAYGAAMHLRGSQETVLSFIMGQECCDRKQVKSKASTRITVTRSLIMGRHFNARARLKACLHKRHNRLLQLKLSRSKCFHPNTIPSGLSYCFISSSLYMWPACVFCDSVEDTKNADCLFSRDLHGLNEWEGQQ